MNILAIETSCDETAAAIISGNPRDLISKPELFSNVVVSQIDIFKAYGGVIPEVAARSHLEAILPVIHQAFKDAGFVKTAKTVGASNATTSSKSSSTTSLLNQDDWSKIDAIAVTHTPGLLGSLLIGTLTARTLAVLHNKPLYAVHHLKSHIYANWLPATDSPTSTNSSTSDKLNSAAQTPKSPQFPLLALVISGGHTQIIYMKQHNHFEIIGTTLDDAVGECFDKVAKVLGLPYPGGPAIAKAANGEIITFANPEHNAQTNAKTGTQQTDIKTNAQTSIKIAPGNPKKYPLPHPKIQNLDFSFSGLKTAVLRAVQKAVNVPISYPSHSLAQLLAPEQIADFAASFEETACDILLEKLQQALSQHPDVKSIVIAGGVSANQRLRKKAQAINSNPHIQLYFPEPRFSGDNAAMVGAAAFYEIASGKAPADPYKLNILPRSAIN